MTKRTPTTQMNNLSFPSLSREELENLLAHLYEMFENVRNFIDLRMIGQSDPLVKKFKKIIKNRLIGEIEDEINTTRRAKSAGKNYTSRNLAC